MPREANLTGDESESSSQETAGAGSTYVLPNNRVLDGLFSDESEDELVSRGFDEEMSIDRFHKRPRRFYIPEVPASFPNESSSPTQDPREEDLGLTQTKEDSSLNSYNFMFNSPYQGVQNSSRRSPAYYDDLIKHLTQTHSSNVESPECSSDEEMEEYVEEVHQATFDVSTYINPFTQAPSVTDLVGASPRAPSKRDDVPLRSPTETNLSSLSVGRAPLCLTGKSAYSQQVALERLDPRRPPDPEDLPDERDQEDDARVSDPLTPYRPAAPTNFDEWMESSLKVVATLLKGSRCIAHIDLDCFYAQVEQMRLDISGDVPLAVQQWNGLLAINYSARKFGISRMETPAEAKRKCRELMLVHVPTYTHGATEFAYHPNPNFATHKASLAPYRQASALIFDIFKSFTPNVQKGGTDEAFIDLTDLVNARILKDCRATANFTPEPLTPLDWKGWGHVLLADQLHADCSPGDHPAYHADFATKYWRSRQLLAGAKIVARIRATVLAQLGYSCGAGISYNKHMAKLCSAQNKPNQQSILLEEAALPFLKDFPVTKIRFMAGKLGHRAAHLFGATCGEMWRYSLKEFQEALGRKDGAFVFDVCRGINHKPVRPIKPMKSLMAGKSLLPPCTDFESLERWLEVLGSELVFRLQEAAEDARWPKSLAVGVYCPTAPNGFQQRQCPMPPQRALANSPNLIAARAIAMCRGASHLFPCKFLCLTALGLEDSAAKMNAAITDFFAVDMDRVPAHPIDPPGPQASPIVQISPTPQASPNVQISLTPQASPIGQNSPIPEPSRGLETQGNYLCPTCNQWTPLQELESHQDYHLALQLQSRFDWEHQAFPLNSPRRPRPPTSSTKGQARGQKRRRGASSTRGRAVAVQARAQQHQPPPLVQTKPAQLNCASTYTSMEEGPTLTTPTPNFKREPSDPMQPIDTNLPRNSLSRSRYCSPVVKREVHDTPAFPLQ